MPTHFSLLGKTIAFDDAQESYFKIRNFFDKTAEDARQKYMGLYQSYGSIENVMEKSPHDFFRLVSDAGNHAVKMLITFGILEVDLNQFLDDYYSSGTLFLDAFNQVEEKYLAIMEHSQEVDEYRRKRRLSRGKLIGGGFGVGGAVKGIAMAGTANMAVGAAHMVFNGLAKAGSAVANSIKKDSLYKDQECRELLFQNLYNAIFMMHYDVVNVIKKHSNHDVFGGFLNSDVKKVDSILNNLRNVTLANDQKLDYYCQMITTYPYTKQIYRSLLQNFNDHNGEIEAIAHHFGIDITADKMQKVKDYLNTEKSKPRNELDALAIKQELINLAAANGLNDTAIAPLIQEIDTVINAFAKKERWVNQIWFDTLPEADTARKEFEAAKQIITAGNSKTIEGLASILKELETANFTTEVNNEQIKALREKSQKIEVQSRTVSGILYNTKEEAATVTEAKKVQNQRTLRQANNFTANIIRFLANLSIVFIYACIPILFTTHSKTLQSITAGIAVLLPIPFVIIRNILLGKAKFDIPTAINNPKKIVLKLELTDEIILAPTGMAWSVLFFGFAVPFDRRDLKNGVIMLISLIVTLFIPISHFIFMFIYNKMYLKSLLKKGFKPYSESEQEKLSLIGL